MILSKNNQLVHISGLEKKFWAKIAKIGCLKPPRYRFFLKFFLFLNARSSCLWGSIGFFVGFLVFKRKKIFKKKCVMLNFFPFSHKYRETAQFLSLSSPFCLCIRLSVSLSISLKVCLPVCLPVYVSVCLSVCLSVCPFVR